MLTGPSRLRNNYFDMRESRLFAHLAPHATHVALAVLFQHPARSYIDIGHEPVRMVPLR